MQFWTEHGVEITTFLTGLWTFIAGLFTTVTGTIALIFEAFTALLNGDTEEFSAKMQEAWQFLWDAIRGAAEVAWAALSAWFQGVVKAIGEFFTKTDWGAVGQGIIDGIWGGLSSGWSWLTGKVSELASALFDAAKKALGIQSPSKVFEGIGLNMMLGWGKGITEGSMIPASATSNAAQMAMAPAAAVSAGPSTYNYSTANNYNLSVMTSQSSQVVQRSFAMMKMLAT
jgi:phage-related protein